MSALLACAAWPAMAQQTSSVREPVPQQTKATLPLPVLLDGQRIGSVAATITIDELIAVSAEELAARLEGLASLDASATLRSLGVGPIAVTQVRATGIEVDYDPATLSLRVSIPAALRGARLVTGGLDPRLSGLERVEPSDFAIGVTGALFVRGQFDHGGPLTSNLLLSGFSNIGGGDGLNLLFGADVALNGGSESFRRDRVIAFHDDQDRALRYSAGDLVRMQPRLAGLLDVLGISIERNYQELQPLRNARPIGRRSFVLERPSLVEIYVNGALVQSFSAQPGPIDLRDIPLADLSNNVSIVVEDDLGRREIDNFSLGSDISLLGENIDEFSFSVGLLRDFSSGRFDYSSDPVIGGYYSRGISEALTATGHLIIAERIRNGGASFARSLLGGIAQVELALSHGPSANWGGAAGLSYRGDPFGQRLREGMLNLRFDVRSRDYREVSSFDFAEDIRFDLAIDYRLRVGERTSVSLGASWFDRHTNRESNHNIFAGMVRQIGRVTGSTSLRYGRRDGRDSEFGVFATLSLSVGRRGNAYASYDSINDVARAEFRRRRSLEFPEVDFAFRAQRTAFETDVGGRFGYGTSRFDAVGDVSRSFGPGRSDRTSGSVRLQSGLAYVDGQVGIGRDPGRGFVMVRRHESLKPATLEVASGAVGRALAVANAMGPAVVSSLSPYRPQEIHVNAIDAPPGYDVGPGGYVLLPGAASGLSVDVGGDAYHIVIVNLLDPEGESIALVSGQLIDLETGGATSFFTNSTGRAVMNGLAPGSYRLLLPGKTLMLEFEVGADAPALVTLGKMRMEQKP